MSQSTSYSSQAFNSLPFRDKLELLYTVSGREKRDLILGSPDAQRLVRSFAVESLSYTVKEVGREDSVELVALASGEQIQGLVDLDCWNKDRLDTSALLDWLEALVEGGSLPLAEFLNAVDLDLLVLVLKRFIRVYRTDDPDEPPETDGPEVFELDEHYPIVFHRWDARAPLIRELLEELYERDYSYFVTVMEEIWWGVESQLEEAAFQFRNARLQDRGFPDFYEALEIYRPLREEDPRERLEPFERTQDPDGSGEIPLERSLLVPEAERTLFAEALQELFAAGAGDELRRELAFLTNRVMVAEGVDFSDREAVGQAVQLAHDTVNLALESLSRGDRRVAIDAIRRHYLQHLFRLGWGLLHGLRRLAKQAEEVLGLRVSTSEVEFLDTPYREALAGLLRPKPRYFRGLSEPGEVRYRTFASLSDFETATRTLEDIRSIPELAERLLGQSLPQLATLRPREADDFRLSATFLTGFANFVLGRGASLQPLDLEELPRLREATVAPGGSRLHPEVRARFLDHVGDRTAFLEFSLQRFEDEFLPIAPEYPYDPRFITCLMIARPASGVTRSASSNPGDRDSPNA